MERVLTLTTRKGEVVQITSGELEGSGVVGFTKTNLGRLELCRLVSSQQQIVLALVAPDSCIVEVNTIREVEGIFALTTVECASDRNCTS